MPHCKHLPPLALAAIIFFAGCQCREDEFGQHLELIVPMVTLPNTDTLTVGDTVTVRSEFSKNVAVKGEDNSIFLEGFNFFTELFISDITDTIENVDLNIEVIERIGTVDFLPLATTISRPITHEEREDEYIFEAQFVVNNAGLILFTFSSFPILFERYEHPAMYTCKANRRARTMVNYSNRNTNSSNYENIFYNTRVNYLLELVSYELYKETGSFTFFVKEP